MNKSNKLQNIYFDWLMKEYSFKDLDSNVVEITIPFLDNDFNYIVMYAEFLRNGKIILTDWLMKEYSFKDLDSNVVESTMPFLDTATLNTITSSLGIEINDNELSIRTDLDKFPIAKQRLLQAIIQVNDMIVLKDSNVKNIFYEEVEHILHERNVLFSSRPSFAGKEGITVQFDFSIPTPKKERLVRTISNGNNLNHAKLLAVDTRLLQNYKKNVEYVALIDDVGHNFNKMAETQAIFEENSNNKISIIPNKEFIANPDILTNVS